MIFIIHLYYKTQSLPLCFPVVLQHTISKITMDEQKAGEQFKQGHFIQQFPIKQQERTCTDIFCAIVAVLFSLILIIVAIIVSNSDHQNRTSFPSDSQGRVCGYDLKNHAYIYFTNFPSIKDRVCVQKCPSSSDNRLNCVPTDSIGCTFSSNPNFTVIYYQNNPEMLKIGSFCVPNSQSLRHKLYEEIDVNDRYAFFQQINSIVICSVIALGIAIAYILLVQFLPKLMNKLSIILGLVFVFAMVLLLIFYPSGSIVARIIISLIILLLIAIVALGAFKSKACLDMHGIFLYHATELIKSKMKILVFIPIFLTVFALFIVIVILELKSLWSSAPISFSTQEVYYTFKKGSTTFATVIVFFQFLWGLSFIKQSFNFCISGNAISWYDKQNQGRENPVSLFKPLYYLFRFNFGSVVAGSFINLVFSLFDYIFDVLRADRNIKAQSHSCLQMLDTLFDLVRSDAMAFINLAGNPFCNSSRYCEALCKRSPIAEYSQSISRSYRICSHFLLGGIVAVLNFFLQGKEPSALIVLLVFVLTLFLCTFFISLHADAAEAIQIIFLLDLQLAKKHEKDKSRHAIPTLKLRNRTIADEYYKQSQELRERVKQEMREQLRQ